jgi:hypothetical protein
MVALGSGALTPIEIALNLRTKHSSEVRIRLVAAFALTSLLKDVIAAIHRAVPARLPRELRIVRAPGRCVEPRLPLERMQSRFVRAIAHGLTYDENAILFGSIQDIGEEAERSIRDFIPRKTPPSLEPANVVLHDDAPLFAVAITTYRLGLRGAPESVLARWTYVPDSRGTIRLTADLGTPSSL